MGANSGALLESMEVLELKIGAVRMSTGGPCVCVCCSPICLDIDPAGSETELMLTVDEVSDIKE